MSLFVLILLVFLPVSSFAIDPLLSLQVGKAEETLQKIEEALKNPQISIPAERLKKYQEQGIFVKKTSNECIDINEKAINKSADDLDLLGAQSLSEDAEVTRKRQSLNQVMLSNAQQLASCRLLLLRAHETIETTLKKQQQALANVLLGKSTSLLENIKNVVLQPQLIFSASLDFIQSRGGLDNFMQNRTLFGGLAIFSIIAILFLKNWLKTIFKEHDEDQSKSYLNRFQRSVIACINHYLPSLIITGVFSFYYLYQVLVDLHWYFAGLLMFGLFLYTLSKILIRVLLRPCPPGELLTGLSTDISALLSSRLEMLIKLLLAGFLMYSALEIHQFSLQVSAFLRNIFVFLLVLNLIWAIWLLRFYEGISNILWLRGLMIAGLIVCLIADWLGYANLAMHILLAITGSIVAWLLTSFVIHIWTDFLDSMDEGRTTWQQLLRKRIGVKEEEFIPGSIWFRFTFSILSWSLFVIALLKIWGLPESSFLTIKESLLNGFNIGTVKVEPLKVVVALFTFAILLSIVGWVKRRMDKSWLKRSRMDRGSKEAMISLTGYFGMATAFLIGLSIAGFELANIALIAGALSVGIGFGLQNIVNNFVSGVILLFERPLKTGDWIVVGGTEGYVKKISIRATQIQTFDRADVMVPNSELISSQVTNWMFRDNIGRIAVPVGVAYGSDCDQVKNILIDIAYQHDEVITKSPILSKPWVLFREFADSSLNFELRCYIKVADSRLRVISDINFAIEKAFRQENIEIPFPQRDVHIVPTDPESDIKNL